MIISSLELMTNKLFLPQPYFKRSSMKYFLFAFILVGSIQSQGQTVYRKMAKYGVSKSELENALIDDSDKHAFKIRINVDSPTETAIKIGEFDPRRPVGKKWKLLSVNGAKPSNSDIKKFDEAHNHNENISVRLKDAQIERESESEFVVKFTYEPSSLPKKYEYLSEVEGMAYISKSKQAIDKITFTNKNSFRYHMLSIDEMVVELIYTKKGGFHHLMEENINIKSTVMFKDIHIKDKQEYFDHVLVK